MTAAARPHAQSTAGLDIVTAMNSELLFAPWFPGKSWDHWRTVLKAAFALPMSEAERQFFRSVAERDPPQRSVRELWCVVGRGGGKDSIASLIAAHAAALFDQRRHKLRPGEKALVMCLACDRDQARIVLNYTRSYFTDIAPLARMVRRETAHGFELNNGVDIAIATNTFRAVRGRTLLCAILDETAFWHDERSATPDEETYRAIGPGLARLPGSILVGSARRTGSPACFIANSATITGGTVTCWSSRRRRSRSIRRSTPRPSSRRSPRTRPLLEPNGWRNSAMISWAGRPAN
jgi:hypothetical protein